MVKRKPKKSHSKKLTKHGFSRLQKNDNLFTIFCGDKSSYLNEQEDFASLVEKSLSEDICSTIIKEKEYSSPAPRQLKNKSINRSFVEHEIDLHGFTADKAEAITESFILSAFNGGAKTVRIITGKGLHSEGYAVLRDIVELKLIELRKKKFIVKFQWENKTKRMSGAVTVYL